jgi:hypothetical protein
MKERVRIQRGEKRIQRGEKRIQRGGTENSKRGKGEGDRDRTLSIIVTLKPYYSFPFTDGGAFTSSRNTVEFEPNPSTGRFVFGSMIRIFTDEIDCGTPMC